MIYVLLMYHDLIFVITWPLTSHGQNDHFIAILYPKISSVYCVMGLKEDDENQILISTSLTMRMEG